MRKEVSDFIAGVGRPTEMSEGLWDLLSKERFAWKHFVSTWVEEPPWTALLAYAWDSARSGDWSTFLVNVPKLDLDLIETVDTDEGYYFGRENFRIAVSSALLHLVAFSSPGIHPYCAVSDAVDYIRGKATVHEEMYPKTFIDFWSQLLPRVQDYLHHYWTWTMPSGSFPWSFHWISKDFELRVCQMHLFEATSKEPTFKYRWQPFFGYPDHLSLGTSVMVPMRDWNEPGLKPKLRFTQVLDGLLILESSSYGYWMTSLRELDVEIPTVVRVDIVGDQRTDTAGKREFTLGFWLVEPLNEVTEFQSKRVRFIQDADVNDLITYLFFSG